MRKIIIEDIWGQPFTHTFTKFEDAVEWAEEKFVRDVRVVIEIDADTGRVLRKKYIKH